MRRLMLVLASVMMLACFAAGCKKEPVKKSVDGCWELSEVQTKAVDYFGTSVSVYVSFQQGRFELYQKIGSGHYRKLTGSYTYADDTLTGKYDSGASLGSKYAVSFEDGRLCLASEGGAEVDVYVKIDNIPSEVTADVLE